ncbi:MAG: hypothetical protein IJ488_00695 [Clostridia bacterium]|nr:hypothetical protein [Clostridia bacterium]
MVIKPKERNIVYRCPDCGSSIFGLVGRFALKANMLRLKCSCENSLPLDINVTNDKKLRLSVPCLFCRQPHNYVVSENVFFERDLFLLNCPYTGMDIAFIGDEDKIQGELKRTEAEIQRLMTSLEAEELSDIQPTELSDDEILCDPAVFDTLKFLVCDLADENKIKCPCGDGSYNIRYFGKGVEVYCERCGATHAFSATTPSMAEEELSIDSLELK